jgi:hypothetical protein
MKKIISFCFLLLIYVSGCDDLQLKKREEQPKKIVVQSLQKSKYGELPNSVVEENINIKIQTKQSNYPMKTDILTYQIKNDGQFLSSGTRYDIEIFHSQSWYTIPFKEDSDFLMIGINIDKGKIYKDTISLKSLKYDLIPGQYRLIKSFYAGTKEIALSSTFHLK